MMISDTLPPRAATLDAIGLVIFDCDGVLIDSEPIASRTLAEALAAAGVAITPQEAHRRFTGNSERDIRAMCARDYGLEDIEGLFGGSHPAARACCWRPRISAVRASRPPRQFPAWR